MSSQVGALEARRTELVTEAKNLILEANQLRINAENYSVNGYPDRAESDRQKAESNITEAERRTAEAAGIVRDIELLQKKAQSLRDQIELLKRELFDITGNEQ